MFFNIPIPNIFNFNFGETVRQRYESHYERKFGQDFRNSVLLEPLEISLANLQNIRDRMESRIEKETASGTDMTQAIKLMAIANQSLDFSAESVAIATSTVSGSDPHPAYQQSQNAYVSLYQSKDSLDAVLNEIIKSNEEARK